MLSIEIALELPRYRDWAPTGFDSRGLGCDDQQDWLVAPVSRNRDSGDLDNSNFEAFEHMLEDACEDCDCGNGCYENHSFGHWACGWFEIVLINPKCVNAVLVTGQVVSALADYPVLDDEDFSRRETESAQECWEWLDMRDRIAACARHGVSIFAARREYYPYELQSYLVQP